jgi:hypothetical protein
LLAGLPLLAGFAAERALLPAPALAGRAFEDFFDALLLDAFLLMADARNPGDQRLTEARTERFGRPIVST